jgi:hypothetical protein
MKISLVVSHCSRVVTLCHRSRWFRNFHCKKGNDFYYKKTRRTRYNIWVNLRKSAETYPIPHSLRNRDFAGTFRASNVRRTHSNTLKELHLVEIIECGCRNASEMG